MANFDPTQHPREARGRFDTKPQSAPTVALGEPEPWKALYTDPYPGRKGSERIEKTCGKCSGTGVYSAPSSISFYTATTDSVTAGCFDCNGTGVYSFLVSSARQTARNRAKRAAEQEERAQSALSAYEQARVQLQKALPDVDPEAREIYDVAVSLRDGMTLESAVAVVRHELERHLPEYVGKPTRFRQKCRACGKRVDAGTGQLATLRDEGWVAYHDDCAPPARTPYPELTYAPKILDRPTQYDTDCHTCAEVVPAGTGRLVKLDRKWSAIHEKCAADQPI